jgi:ribosomal protein L11 methyltransferase
MSWTEIIIRAKRKEWQYLEGALQQVGALSVTLLDVNDEPILEPNVGEMPLWRELIVNALFDATVDRRGLVAVLQELVYTLDGSCFSFRDVEDADWTKAWIADYQPMSFGRRLWIFPSTIEPPADSADQVVVRLDPGLAFGTGTHPTTALCLEWLDALDLNEKTVLDYGCGSGILAIAALRLGAHTAMGVDNDPQALMATEDNADRNGVRAQLYLQGAEEKLDQHYDVVVSNILANALVSLAPVLLSASKPGGVLALSGILLEQVDQVTLAYQKYWDDVQISSRDGWVCIMGRRNLNRVESIAG